MRVEDASKAAADALELVDAMDPGPLRELTRRAVANALEHLRTVGPLHRKYAAAVQAPGGRVELPPTLFQQRRRGRGN